MQDSYDKILKLPIRTYQGDANGSKAQFVLVETPECEPEAGQTHSISKGQNQTCPWVWGHVGASAPFPALEGEN